MSNTSVKDRFTGQTASNGNQVEIPENDEEIQVFNAIPNYPAGYKFGDKFVIGEKIDGNGHFGVTYLATLLSSDQKLLFHVNNIKENHRSATKYKYKLLSKAHEHQKHHFFIELHEHGPYENEHFWYTTYCKSGPTLRQITEVMRRKGEDRLSTSTVGRLAQNLFEIAGFIHQNGFLICAMDQNMFEFDARFRTLFLSDMSSIQPKPTGVNNLVWHRGLHYSPMVWSWHAQNYVNLDRLTTMELESVFYLILDLALGGLPWASDSLDDVAEKKRNLFRDGKKFLGGLPKTYFKLWKQIVTMVGRNRPYSDLSIILNLCQQIYKNDGACASWNDKFDFERDRTSKELPELVMEKVAKDSKSMKDEQKTTEGNTDDDTCSTCAKSTSVTTCSSCVFTDNTTSTELSKANTLTSKSGRLIENEVNEDQGKEVKATENESTKKASQKSTKKAQDQNNNCSNCVFKH
ncbi:unnamed protein product [Bursaphelenchus okinawaensis]|uniref:Protein kinase domain-containing protein n=1 Tax=Bursaphelenchus okinawaensis TaxID=465554 RepID=A0A811K1K4_9BILA|nr:unnamed protein product [Bursaphelenchus okinawaensis]CAG9089833.1 unnamed protein product [Bursaphelenchus okinawaensis]